MENLPVVKEKISIINKAMATKFFAQFAKYYQ
jgi:hypothetical protein